MAGERNKNQFINGLEFANLAVCSDLPLKAWNAVSEIPQNDSAGLISVTYKVKILSNGTKVIAFSSSPVRKFLEGEKGREFVSVSSSDGCFGFLCTKKNPMISVHKAAIDHFVKLLAELTELKDQIDVEIPLIITGHSLGGSIASLFTLWLLDNSYAEIHRRPLCITFGSPLLGDNAFQEAISEHPTWISCFLHIISNHDPIPTTLASTRNGIGAGAIGRRSSPTSTQSSSSVLNSTVYFQGFIKVILYILAMLVHLISFSSPRILIVHLNQLLCYLTILAPNPIGYMPFGTTLFLSDTGSACFEESGSVLELIKTMSSGDLSQEIIDYGGILKKLKYKAINEDDEMVGDDSDINNLWEGITLQIHAATGANQEVTEMDSLVKTIEINIGNFLRKKAKAFDPNNKLAEMRIQMAYMEWYKKTAMKDGGYYDLYKNAASRSGRELTSREELKKYKLILAQYWDKAVMEIEKMPKRKGENNIPSRWLYAGTNYRRMVEPLDIAEYYKQGKTDYLTAGNARSKHYILLEQWQKNAKPVERKRPCSMTEDSCFWAHLEEAILSCNVLKERKIINWLREKSHKSSNNLIEFEKYIMERILGYAVSTEIFLEGSSFMNWWTDYKRIKGPGYKSELTAFMENEKLGNGSMVLNEYLESSK